MDVVERETIRASLMSALYDVANGSERKKIRPNGVQETLQLEFGEFADACKYLEQEGLITANWTNQRGPFMIWLTHKGVTEEEASRRSPTEATENLAPYQQISQTFNAPVIGSPMQVGSSGATQTATVTVGNVDLSIVHEFLDAWDNSEDVNALSEDVAAEANGQVEVLRALVKTKNPPHEFLVQTLHSIRAVLEGGGGLLVGTGVLEALHAALS